MHATQEPAEEVRLLTISEVAERLSLSRALTYELVMGGSIQSVKIGRCRRVSTDALATFVRQLEVAA